MLRILTNLLLYCAALGLATHAWSETTPPAAADGEAAAAQTEQWLEQVRAQREAWEARRKAAKQAADERLRRIDPWGAARLQSMEQAAELRREALLNRSEDLRKRAEAEREARRKAYDAWLKQKEIQQGYPPYGWDNRWYYRGY